MSVLTLSMPEDPPPDHRHRSRCKVIQRVTNLGGILDVLIVSS